MLQIRHRFPAQAASAAAARRAVEGLLASSSPGSIDDARIIVSELVTRSILNSEGRTDGWIDLTLKVSRNSLRIEVKQGGPGLGGPMNQIPKEDALSESSRFIVERLADEWGTGPGTEVWAVLAWSRGEGTRSRENDAHHSLSLRF